MIKLSCNFPTEDVKHKTMMEMLVVVFFVLFFISAHKAQRFKDVNAFLSG